MLQLRGAEAELSWGSPRFYALSWPGANTSAWIDMLRLPVIEERVETCAQPDCERRCSGIWMPKHSVAKIAQATKSGDS